MAEYTNKELYVACKNKVGFHRSDRFKEWFHDKYPRKQMHHIYGSYSQSLKTSDYCSVPVTSKQHEVAEKDKSNFAVDNLSLMLQVMIGYIIYLEELVAFAEVGEEREGVKVEVETEIILARCSFCEENFEVENTRKLQACPKCYKPLKLIKRK